ncbi:L,D-transpeptidase family protein [Clostridium sp. SHJSY1]|uniref:L,D-transpeptidase family protein n=1 Tax=Clostridium sp. SHJSY1 TaxID=2942483 RepID=UPI00287B8D5E|nr:L,D-transpeptidase family protein [Clostridium sp. SHJSY1]
MESEKSEGSRFAINRVIGSKLANNTVKKGIIISFSTLLVIYLGMSLYFINHFYFGSKVNGVNISGKTVKQADDLITSQTESYSLNIKERGDKEEQINAADVGLKSDSTDKIQELKDSQKPFAWIVAPFINQDAELTGIVSLDETKLNSTLDKLNCLISKNIVSPQNAKLSYTEEGYKIVDEVYGNKINKDSFYSLVKKTILNEEPEIDLDKANCYENPKFTTNSQQVVDAKETANKYLVSQITYTFGDKNEVLDKATIHNWISVNDNFEIVLNESKIKDYINTLDDKYGTVGKARDFKTSSGETKKVGAYVQMNGANKADPDEFYGWSISTSKETKDLIENIKNGQSVTKEPKYAKQAKSHGANDIGNTYVEISLSKQHLWFYKNGSLVVDGNVVTGNVAGSTETPPGVYKIKYKESPSTLKGNNADGTKYAEPVEYWMPFNSGIGIHDLTKRNAFGGNIYLTNGSHGCVNSPLNLAQKVYENIEAGTPVVVY